MSKWWVNDPNGVSVHYPTKQRAKNVASQVKGASVSKTPKGGKHSKGGCFSIILAMLGILTVLALLFV